MTAENNFELRKDASSKLYYFLAAVAWLISSFSYFLYYGVSKGGDAGGFMRGVDYFLRGEIKASGVADYFTYIWSLVFLKVIGVSFDWMVLFQFSMHAFGTASIYKIIKKITGQNNAAIFGVAAYSFFPAVSRWSCYLLTDSLFISMIPIITYLMFFSRHNYKWVWLSPLVLYSVLLRPNGIILLAGIGSVIIYETLLGRNKNHRRMFFVALLVLLPLVLYFIDRKFHALKLVEIFASGNVVWSFQEGSLLFPADGYVPRYESELLNIILFVFHNPIYFFKLMITKVYYFWTLSLPINSIKYQLISLIVWVPTLLFLIKGYLSKLLPINIKVFIGGILLSQTFMVAITYNDYDLRFMHHLFPLIAILWAVAFFEWQGLFSKRNLGLKLLVYFPLLSSVFFALEYLAILRLIKSLILSFV